MLPHKKNLRCKMRPASKNKHQSNHLGDSPLCHIVLHTHFFKKYVTTKAIWDNYDDLTYSKKHIQNIRSILKVVRIKNNSMCKIFSVTFHGNARVMYHNLDQGSILGLHEAHLLFSHKHSN